jgi:hypothetical protein
MGPFQKPLAALLLVLCLSDAVSMATKTTSSLIVPPHAQPSAAAENSPGLNTYAITLSDVQLATVADESRVGTTRLKVQLTAGKVQPVVPVVTTAKSGLQHNVLDGWRLLKVSDAPYTTYMPISTLWRFKQARAFRQHCSAHRLLYSGSPVYRRLIHRSLAYSDLLRASACCQRHWNVALYTVYPCTPSLKLRPASSRYNG